MNYLRKIFYLTIFFFFSTNFDSHIYYALFAIVVILIIIYYFKKKKIPIPTIEDKIAVSFIFVWIYGVVVGVLRGNQINYVVANFAGMACYLSYFCMVYLNCKLSSLTKILLYGGLFLSVYSVLRMYSFLWGINIPFINADIGISSTGQLRVYFITMSVAYALMGGALYAFLVPSTNRSLLPIGLNNKLVSFLLLGLTIVVFFIISSSKGFLLGGMIILFMIPLALYIKKLLRGRMNKNIFIVLLIICILFIVLIYSGYFSIIEMLFDSDDIANRDRYDQLSYLINDCTLIGKGLGAVVPGIVRSEEGPYGFELTYINLVHKFGIVSIVLFINWLYMFIVLFRFIVKRKQTFYAVIALASLGYMFPSIGNPLLMHPSMVMLNCMSLYFIRKIRQDGKNFGVYGHL